MDDDQQFCLRWNNHQSTLISVFDTLLENGTLVDCTLAAEGKFLKAHKVVLSACSPYFAALLSQQYDKHPIFILKDVKFQELRAMMDYMYRGEVNISQDQLAALLKAAESLQIKGLSDSRSSTSSQQQKNEATTSKTLPPPVPAAKASGLTIENKRPLKSLGATDSLDADLSGSREGSTSPTSRKRKKIRRKSIDANIMLDNHDQHSNSSSHSMHTTTAPSLAIQSTTIVASTTGNTNQQHNSATSLSAPSNNVSNVLSVATIKKTENIQQHQQQNDALKLQIQMKQHQDDDDDDEDEDDDDGGDDNDEDDHDDELMENENEMQQQNIKLMNRHQQMDLDNKNISQSELMIEPKNEYDDGHDENVEDLTLDEEELLEDMEQAGPSHGGEGSSQGYAQWQMERAQDEAFMAAQDAVGGQHRDAQESFSMLHTLLSEPERYKYPIVSYTEASSKKSSDEIPAQCPNCKRIYANQEKVRQHIKKYCLKEKKYQCMFCQYRSKRKDHIIRHTDRVHPVEIKNKLQLGLIKSVTEAFVQVDVDGGDNSSEFLNLNFSIDMPTGIEKYDYNGDVTTIDESDENDDGF